MGHSDNELKMQNKIADSRYFGWNNVGLDSFHLDKRTLAEMIILARYPCSASKVRTPFAGPMAVAGNRDRGQ
jgi:hypothetical protein